jgi:soluble lytic murein transglycosylase
MRFLSKRSRFHLIVGSAGFVLGLLGTAVWSSGQLRMADMVPAGVTDVARLDGVSVLPRAKLMLLAVEAEAHLNAGRPWTAWRMLRSEIEDTDDAPAGAVMLAARAAGAWGGWDDTRSLLAGREWLDDVDNGEGWYLLGRAEAELDDADAAVAAYRRYLRIPGGDSRGPAYVRLGTALREADDAAGAAAAFAGARDELPLIEDWLFAMQVEQLAEAGTLTADVLATVTAPGSAPARTRRVRAEVSALLTEGDTAAALAVLERQSRLHASQGAYSDASLQVDRGRLLLASGRQAQGRELLRSIAWESTIPASTRRAAAEVLGDLSRRTTGEDLARAAALEAADQPGLAAKAMRSAIAAGAPGGAALQLKLARLLYAERDYGPARSAFERAADMLSEPESIAEARLYAARSRFRASSSGRAPALAEMRDLAARYPETAAAGAAFFLLGDEARTLESALAYYRRAAAIGRTPEAREALFRVGDRSLRLDDPAGALRAWGEYVERYPRGDETARVAYEAGKLHERAGRTASARAMYTAATLADPISYYAMRAGDRLGLSPLEAPLSQPRPWVGRPADPIEAGNVLNRLDALRAVGLDVEWKAELDAATRAFTSRPAALLLLAEGLRDRHHPVEALRLGYRLLEARSGEWDNRLLRIIFPLPYQDLIESAAQRYDVDPMFLASLIRQESVFQPAVKSWVGATGLGQIMPATGRWLAPSVGVTPYDERLLAVPEVNLRMSASYLGDLLDRYDGARDLALAGYNAGPSRADRWRRTLGHGGDPDVFRDRIPFDETRHYVKTVIRNASIYERLYGEAAND